MSVVLDTSIVVRLLVGLPEAQFRAARRRLEESHANQEPVIVLDLVILETFFALRHHYQIPEAEVRSALRRFLESGLVTCDPPGAESLIASKGGPGLADRLICLRSNRLASTLLTFDRDQAQLEAAELLA